MQGWKKTSEEQDNFYFGQKVRSGPVPTKVVHPVFTSSLNTKSQGFALEKDYCGRISYWRIITAGRLNLPSNIPLNFVAL